MYGGGEYSHGHHGGGGNYYRHDGRGRGGGGQAGQGPGYHAAPSARGAMSPPPPVGVEDADEWGTVRSSSVEPVKPATEW